MVINEQPITVWLSYNVSGNEPSSSEAAMQTVYRLVAGTDAETQSMRSESGTLVATEDAAEFAIKDASGFTSIELVKKADSEEEASDDKIDPEAFTPYAACEDTSGLKRIPGSAFKGQIDNTNPLAFWIPVRLYSLKFSDEALKPSTN